MSSIDASGVGVRYRRLEAVDGVDVQVQPGEWLGLIGPNGGGKSSLLRALAGLVPSRGRIRVDGIDVGRAGERRRARAVAYVPQSPVAPPGMSVTQYLMLGRTPHLGYLGREGRRDHAVVAEVLERLDLGPLAARPLGELSGGERQRAAVARALVQQAPVLLLDEPTSALDLGHQLRVLELVARLRAEDGLTVVAAMHDLTLAGQFADRLLLLAHGRAVATGTPAEVLTEPLLARHYGAEVRVLRSAGTLVVVPHRATGVTVAAAELGGRMTG